MAGKCIDVAGFSREVSWIKEWQGVAQTGVYRKEVNMKRNRCG